MKKSHLILLCFIIFALKAFAQPQSQWVRDIGSNNHEYGTAICSDASGNSYVGGSYWQSLIICNDTLVTVAQTSGGNLVQNLLISKFDSSGNCIWTKAGINKVPYINGGAIGAEVNDIVIRNGFIYCVGVFTDTLIFDTDTLYNPACQSYCTSSFVMQLDTNGNINWAKALLGNSGYSRINSVESLTDGILVAGGYQGSLSIDSILLNPPNPWNYNGYMLKFNSFGNCLWGINIGITPSSEVYDIAYDNDHSIYVIGDYTDTITFPSGAIYDSIPYSQRSTYIAKYDTSANFIWASGGYQKIKGIFYNQNICYGNNMVYITASFKDTIIVNFNILSSTVPLYYKDMIARLDTAGQFAWVKSTGNRFASQNYPSTIEIAADGFLLTSSYMDTVISGIDTIVSTSASTDILFTRYTNSGNVLWNKHFGGNYGEEVRDINFNNGNIYLTAWSGSSYTIDGFPVNNTGGSDLLVACFRDTLMFSGNNEFTDELSFLKVFPNPSHGDFTIENSDFINHILVTNIAGQIVNVSNEKCKFKRMHLDRKGLYFIEATCNGRRKITTVVII